MYIGPGAMNIIMGHMYLWRLFKQNFSKTADGSYSFRVLYIKPGITAGVA